MKYHIIMYSAYKSNYILCDFKTMCWCEVLDFFDAEDVDLRKYPIIFDSWSGSQKLIGILSDLVLSPSLFTGEATMWCVLTKRLQDFPNIRNQ